MSETWDNLVYGWRKLYRRAANAITRFSPEGKASSGSGTQEAREISVRSTGWGLLAAEVFDDDDKVVVRLEAPGMDKDGLDIQVRDDYLVVRGEKRVERERTEGRYHVSECAYGRFERAIPLPEQVETGKASAKYNNGVLRVELPKLGPRRRKSIRVEVS
jgi:HSP20 family protein